MNTVHKLTPETESSPAGEPVQFTVRAILPDGRDITATVAHYPDRSGPTINGLLDQTMDVLDRVRARCEIPELDDKIRQGHELMTEATESFARINTETDAKIEELKTKGFEAVQKRSKKEEELKAGISEGRRFEPNSPGNKRILDPMAREALEIADQIKKLEDTREGENRNFIATKLKHQKDISVLEARLSERKKIVQL